MASKRASSLHSSSARDCGRTGSCSDFELFELAHLLRVGGRNCRDGSQQSYPAKQGAASTVMQNTVWANLQSHSILVLLISNGTLLLRLQERDQVPILKHASWFQSPSKSVKAIALDPSASWLVCVCKDTNLYIVPVLSLLQTSSSTISLTNKSWHTDDLSQICAYKQGPPSCVLWWQTTDDRHLAIVGTKVGEIVFVDVQFGKKVKSIEIKDEAITSLQLIRDSVHQATYLLVHTASSKTWRMLLECRPPDSSSPTVHITSPAAAVSLGYEMINAKSNIPLDTCLISEELRENFLPKPLNTTNPNVHHSVQHARNQVLVGVHDQIGSTFQVYDVDIELPMFIYQLVPFTQHVVLTDRLLFVISKDKDKKKSILNILSSQMSETSSLVKDQQKTDPSIIQKFVLPVNEEVLAVFKCQTSMKTSEVDPYLMMDGCVIVTSCAVYECRPRIPPKALFLDLVVNHSDTQAADRLAITVGLDVNTLYETAADQVLMNGDLPTAMGLYELAKCSHRKRVEKFIEHGRMCDILAYIKKMLSEPGAVRPKERKMLSNLAIQCFTHQVLVCDRDQTGQARLAEDFNQFINDNFDYDEHKALEILADNGLKEHLFAVAKARGLVTEALEILGRKGLFNLPSSVQAILASRGLTDIVSKTCNGAFIHCMSPEDAVSFLLAKPEAVLYHVKYLESILCSLDETSLLKLSRALDPSRPMSRNLLSKAASYRRNRTYSSSSISSLDSSSSSNTEDVPPQASLTDVVQLFLCTLLILNSNRKLTDFPPVDIMLRIHEKVSGRSGTASASTGNDKVYQRVRLSCGQHHAALVSRNGELYTWGKSQHGRLGHGDLIEEEGKSPPFRVEILHMHRIKVTSVACGTEHTLALCTDGVYAWGSSEYGQIGVGDTKKHTRPVFVCELAEKQCVAIACGHYHSIALSADQRVWTWGWGVHGQLGHGSAEDNCLPCHVQELDQCNVVQISAGYSHTAVLTNEGDVLTFGGGLYGQLGLGSNSKYNTPQLVTALKDQNVKIICCGSFETICVTDNQKIYTWGRNAQFLRHAYKKAEIRRGGGRHAASLTELSHKLFPTLMDFDLPSNVVQMSCGNWHYLVLTDTGHMFSWGCNDQGQLGHGNRADLSYPKLVQGIHGYHICAVDAGSEFSVAMDTTGQVWVWGRADSGQLGLESIKPSVGSSVVKKHFLSPVPLTSLPAVARNQFEIVQEVEESREDQNRMIVTWHLPDLLSLGSTQVPYNRESLVAALCVLEGRYDPDNIIRHCLDLEDFFMASVICEIQKQWPHVLAYRLHALSQVADMFKDGKTEAFRHKAEEVITYTLRHYADSQCLEETKPRLWMMQDVFRFWSYHELGQGSLESLLLTQLDLLAYPLTLILVRDPALIESSSDSGSSAHSKDIPSMSFSSSFLIKITKSAANQILTGQDCSELVNDLEKYFTVMEKPTRETSSVSTSTESEQAVNSSQSLLKSLEYKLDTSLETMEITEGKLWQEIIKNIEKDLVKRPWATLSMTAAATIAAAAVSQPKFRDRESVETVSSKSDTVVFTCSHQFVRFYFLEVVLPEFQQRVKELPIPLPSMMDVLLIQYKKQFGSIPTACPVCVFNTLRYEQLQLYSDMDAGEIFRAKQWEI